MKSVAIETVWNGPNSAIASAGGAMPRAAMPKITIGIEGGMTMPRPPADAVTAEAKPRS